ncbi:MAG: transglycosylase SLT domain-containing protein [Granulosicoccus sp.]
MTDSVPSDRSRWNARARRLFLLGWALTSPVLVAESTANSAGQALDKQRELFVLARAQLASGEMTRFEQSVQELRDYPLHDYLLFEQLRKAWSDEKPTRAAVGQLNAFEKRTGHASMTRRLTRHLQRRLADTEQWGLFLGVSKSRLAAEMPCTTLRARYERGRIKGFDNAVLQLWVKPEKLPNLCADVINQVEAAHTPPVTSIWERIYQAMDANKPEYATSMLTYLASVDRKRVQRWIDAGDSPSALLQSNELDANDVLNRRIIADLLVDWSRKDTLSAIAHWFKIRDNYTFYEDRYYDIHRALVMRAAYRRLPEAQGFLEATNGRADDLELAEWRVRTALLAEDWPAVLSNIARLPREEQEEDHWAYWVARANEQLGRQEQADQIYAELATLQSYHGFLSADKLGRDYAIYDEPIVPAASLISRLRNNPDLVRAREFDRVGIDHESRREWNNWLAGRAPDELAVSAVLASEWGLYDRAIYSAGRSGEENRRAIKIRFPILYRSEVARSSSEHGIEPSWIFGVMRRESAYIEDVQSGAGAVGLMQLMPRTARYVADLQGKKNWRGDLTDAATNIDFGTHYLRYVMNRFDDHQVLATASYNAGPHRVDQWLLDKEIDADVWIDTIVFTETRRYVRAVMAYSAIYEYHLTGEAQPLSRKLTTVPAAPSA